VDFSGQRPLGKCPVCGSPVYEQEMNYICEKTARRDGCTFRVGRIILQRPIEREEMEKLLATGRTDLLEKFISKKGRPFKAYLVSGAGGKVGFEFEPRQPKAPAGAAGAKEAAPQVDLSKAEAVAKCPACGGRVLETPRQYLCENFQNAKKPCRFKISRTILQQPIDRVQLGKLAADGRTDVLHRFISKRGRPFSAALVWEGNRKIVFEFGPPQRAG
jgi:hypothetical protein